jgi:crotonobetainyl-CoA:carnitine CoA-transferase CaiB-like acyl-CoA transferase
LNALAGVLVADLSQNLAGPYCTQILADLGARVIKIEPPGGDPARAWGPPFHDGQSTLFLSANRNKQSVVLDLKSSAGTEVLRALLGRADVFVQSFRAGVVESLGFGAAAVRAAHPRLIYCSVTAYGARGPLRDLPGYDPLLQARGGLMSVTGQPGTPARVGTSLIDMGTGMWAALGIMTALSERERTGQGQHVVASLYDTALAWSAYHLMGWFAEGVVPEARGAGFRSIAPYGAFPASGGTLMIAAANDGLFRRLCDALGLRSLRADERFADNPGRVANRDELDAAIARATASHSLAALVRLLDDAGVPCAPILRIDEVARDPQAEASGMIAPAPAEAPRYRGIALPLEWDGQRPSASAMPPRVGQHTAEVLEELGFDPLPPGPDATTG